MPVPVLFGSVNARRRRPVFVSDDHVFDYTATNLGLVESERPGREKV